MELTEVVLLDRPNFLEEIESEEFGDFCRNLINMNEIIQAPRRWFNSVSDMFSRLLDEGDNSSATASDGSADQVVDGRNDEESVAAICNKPEDEPAEVILDKTSSGSVEADDNTSACDDEGKELCPLNNPDNEFILSADAEENEESTDTNSSHCSSPKKTDETCASQESASVQVCSSNEGDEPAEVDNLEPYVQPQKDGDVLSSEDASLIEDYASPNKIDAAPEKISMLNSADVADLENEVEHEFEDVDLQDTDDEDYDHTLENIDISNSADAAYLENKVEHKFEDVDLQNIDDEIYDHTLVSYSEHKHKPYKLKFGASLISKLRWLKAKKHADNNVQYDTDMETHGTHGFARSTPLNMKLLDDSLDSEWELL
ncbi:uncharacterized protein LOC109716625 [Ananas comosus]|uniref:Uncharacterized protein LOC109716625 n=1 Tax=Ananas comosus TaxID=4615 RepID=A0A6P5FXN4_ANACO|nr:uncharacterized protein LOC109716625 [Ananas comosus]